MSVPKLTKKQKKGLAFRERKGSKRQVGDVTEVDNAVPVVDVNVGEDVIIPEAVGQEAPEESIVKAGKKRKREVTQHTGEEGLDAANNAAVDDPSKRMGKKRKLSRETQEEKAKGASSKTRFILFVGNLRYTTSLEEIQEHFSACDPPPQIRLLTPKPKLPGSVTTKSKGCAFLEFSHRNALQQALKLHGSTLDGRRINVELTAGGGGKGDKRVEKVKARNKQLIEERKARVQKKAESNGGARELDITLTAPPQRHSTSSGIDDIPQNRRTWTVSQDGEKSGRGGAKQRGKKGKVRARNWGTGANSIAVG